jgi:hypothetical protein
MNDRETRCYSGEVAPSNAPMNLPAFWVTARCSTAVLNLSGDSVKSSSPEHLTMC